MDSAQQNTASNNRGAGLFSYHCDTKILEWVILHNIPDAKGGFIGAAPEGAQGITLFSLGNGISPIYGSVKLNAEEELLLYTKGLYTTIVSGEYPAGEIRGQIAYDYDWWAYLSGTNVVSPVTTPAVGVATMTLFGEQNRKLDYSIFHNVEYPLRATLNVAKTGVNGELDLVFPTVFSPIRGNDIVFDDDELEAFATDSSYITITSIDYPFVGEIRGQIRRINPCKTQNDNELTVSVSGLVNDNNDSSDDKNHEVNFSTYDQIPFYSSADENNNNDSSSASTMMWSIFSLFTILLSVFI